MTRLLLVLVLFQALVASCHAAEDPPVMRVSNDGLLCLNPTGGSTVWTGNTIVRHPRFHLTAQGSVTLFAGPSIHRRPDVKGRSRNAGFKAETQWISLVALGSVSVTAEDAAGRTVTVVGERVIYLPVGDRLLIDGKPWPCTSEPETAHATTRLPLDALNFPPLTR